MTGKAFITATFNNTLVTITDMAGFKGARRATPYAATMAVEAAARKAMTGGIKEVEVYLKGPGSGRDAALRALKAAGLKMNLIADVTPIPHNGTRPSKKRRV